jgi:pyruvate-ferredoxin/flavodoxin oxidoreductase
MATNVKHAKELVEAGYLVLLRYDPRRKAAGQNPLQLDSKKPKFDLAPLLQGENRFAALKDIYPKEAELKFPLLLQDLKEHWEYYEKMAGKA